MSHLLHNMSMRPRTDVRWQVPAVAGVVAVFALRDPLPPAGALDAAWESYGLRGAMLVLPAPCASAYRSVVAATDMLLCANVLARTRGRVLTATAPLTLAPGNLARRLASDDPRLVALARELA